MYDLAYAQLPLTDDPRQVFTVDPAIDGESIHARVEIRYLSAPDLWVISLWDDAAGVLLVNQVPLVASYGAINDLFRPFRHLRSGRGVGTLLVLRKSEDPAAENPAAGNLTEYNILWGDTFA